MTISYVIVGGQEDIGSELIADLRLDGRDMMGKRPLMTVDDDESPLPKSHNIDFPSYLSPVESLVKCYGGQGSCTFGTSHSFSYTPPTPMSPGLTFQYSTFPSSGVALPTSSQTNIPPFQRFVPSLDFSVNADGGRIDSVKDFMDNVVPNCLIPQSKQKKGTTQLVEEADFTLLRGCTDLILAL